ncbi:MAG: hypothetical protein LBH76_02410 [Propionibacteriaceae bacterium]|nr:hypothetical protein [Propionibacteriaceae bacterium]
MNEKRYLADRRAAKRQGASVNDLLLAAFALTWCRGDAALKSLLLWSAVARFAPYRWLSSHFASLLDFPPITFTNIGLVSNLVFGGAVAREAHVSTAVKPSPFLQVTASTDRGRLTLPISITGDDAASRIAQGILAGAAERVVEFGRDEESG